MLKLAGDMVKTLNKTSIRFSMPTRYGGDSVKIGWRWGGDGVEIGWKWGGDRVEIGVTL